MTPVAIRAPSRSALTGGGNWTWLISGRVPTLVDAGGGQRQHVAAIQEALCGGELAQVLVTHAHRDHANGAPVLADRFPGARFCKYPWPERDAKWAIPWQALSDREVIVAGDTSLMAIHTPGHTRDHLSFWHDETRTLFCGDLVIKGATVWIAHNQSGDVGAYMTSVARVLDLVPRRLLPAHGPAIDDPIPLLRHCLARRRHCESRVLSAVRVGAATTHAITAHVYGGLDTPLLLRAQETVLAHLTKLEREGQVRSDEGRWSALA